MGMLWDMGEANQKAYRLSKDPAMEKEIMHRYVFILKKPFKAKRKQHVFIFITVSKLNLLWTLTVPYCAVSIESFSFFASIRKRLKSFPISQFSPSTFYKMMDQLFQKQEHFL